MEHLAEIEALLNAAYPDPNAPGAAVIVVKDGETILRKGYGLANLEWNIPNTPDTVFRIGSVTKQFTAVAILMLVEQGKLSLQDPIEKHFPGYPTHGHTITVEHLLNHTSGIKSYTSMESWPAAWGREFKAEELVDFFKFQPMDFAPGQKWSYNNSAFVLAGMIVEKVSGLPLADFLRQNIFEPLGMKDTVLELPQQFMPHRAYGYDKTPTGYRPSAYISMTQPLGAGGMVSTVDDLARWEQALLSNQLLPAETLQKAFTPVHLPDGSSTHYGYGWFIHDYEGFTLIDHGGGIHGFVCHVLRVPSEKVFVAVLTNNGEPETSPYDLVFQIATLLTGKPYRTPTPIELPADQLARLAAVYQTGTGEERYILCEEGKLFYQHPQQPERFEILPISADEFYPPRMALVRLHFTNNEDGSISGYEMRDQFAVSMETGQRTEKPLPEKG